MKYYLLLKTFVLLNLPSLAFLAFIYFFEHNNNTIFMISIAIIGSITLTSSLYFVLNKSLDKTGKKLHLNLKAQSQFEQITLLSSNHATKP